MPIKKTLTLYSARVLAKAFMVHARFWHSHNTKIGNKINPSITIIAPSFSILPPFKTVAAVESANVLDPAASRIASVCIIVDIKAISFIIKILFQNWVIFKINITTLHGVIISEAVITFNIRV